MVKGMLFIVLAIFIDGLQAVMMLLLSGAFAAIAVAAPVVGAGAGALGGCVVGATVGLAGVVFGGVGIVPGVVVGCVGGAATGAAGGEVAGSIVSVGSEPMGIAAGFALDTVFTFTFGVFLITLLAFFGLFSAKYVWPIFTGKTIPGLNLLPTWTGLVVFCLIKKKAEDKKGGLFSAPAKIATGPSIGSVAGVVGGAALGRSGGRESDQNTTPTPTYNPNTTTEEDLQENEPRVLPNLKSMPSMSSDINPRAANDNIPKTYANAA